MTDNSHPVDDALRRLARDAEPNDDDRRLAESRLQAATASETQRRTKRLRFATVGWALGALIGAIGLLLLLQAIRPTPTRAAMEEIAAVVEVSDPLTIPPQQYAYTKSETTTLRVVPKEGLGDIEYNRDLLVYLLPAQRETWVGSDNVVRLRTTAGEPVFFRPEDETAYYAADLDAADMVGETVTETVSVGPDPQQWPEGRDQLDQAIRAAASSGERPEAVEYVDAALDVIREALVSPEARANTLRLVAEQPGVTLEQVSEEGSKTFAIEYSDTGIATRLSFTIHPQGHLLAETETLLDAHPQLGIPARTTVSRLSYSEPVIVPSLTPP